ncbi:MAG: VCBS repeat-containing protein [Bacteroidota bacterium]
MKKHILLLTSSLLLHTMLMAQQFSEQPIPGLPALTNSKAEWSDLDNNGFVDLLVSGQTDIGADYFNVFLNIGDGSFTASSAGISTLANMQFGLADLNHDGFIDLFVSGEDGAGQANTTYYANDGDGSFTGSVTGLVQLKDGDFALKDFDQDGDIDLIYSGRDDSSNRQTVAYRNENGELINETISLPGLANGAIKAADFNGDGLADVLLSGIGNAANRVTEVYLNEGNWNFSASANSFIATAFNQIAVSDIDLNGSLDFVMTGISDSGFQSLYYSNENGVFSLSNIGLTAFASGQVGIADFNGDQYPDILIGGSTSGGLFENQYLRSDGLTGFDNRVSPLDQITNGSYAVADFNKDSYVDVYYQNL